MVEMSRLHRKEWDRDHDGWNIRAGMDGGISGVIKQPGTQNSATRTQKKSLFIHH